MNKNWIVMTTSCALLLAALPLAAHQVNGIDHSHAFEQTGYGTYRQGHSVNNELGNIQIMSAKPHTGYQSGSAVEFARPQMITKAPTMPFTKSTQNNSKTKQYGKKTKKDYGKK